MKVLMLVLIMLFGVLVNAKTPQEICKDYYNFAETVMKSRQSNTSIIKLVEIVGDNKALNTIILEAYKVPLYQTDSYKVQAQKDFANKIYLTCTSSIS